MSTAINLNYCLGNNVIFLSKNNSFPQNNNKRLVITASRNHFFTCWSEEQCMLKLGCIAAFNVTEWRVGLYNSWVTQVLQCHQVLGLSQTVQPAATESQSAKVIVDDIQEMLGFWQSGKKANMMKCLNDFFLLNKTTF